MKITCLTLLLLSATLVASAQIKLSKRSFLNGKLELLVPEGFKQMSNDMIAVKYPNRPQQPDAVLTDEDGTINLLISYLPQHIQQDQMAQFGDFQIRILTERRPDLQLLDKGVKKINGKNAGYFNFMVTAVDQKVFNCYFFTDLEGRILLCTFNCTEKLLPAWKTAAQSIVDSFTVK